MSEIAITYFSDVLCVWAYVAQARIEAVKEKFGASVRIEHRFCSVFGDTAAKIASTWKDRGGYEGFGTHLQHVADRFPHVVVHPEIWLKTRPPSSASPHLFMKAVQHGNASLRPPDLQKQAFLVKCFGRCVAHSFAIVATLRGGTSNVRSAKPLVSISAQSRS